MWNYTPKVLDHFRNPRNVGVVENPDGTGTVGSLACGDSLTLTFKLGPDGRIADVKFQTFGCASAIASSSALTELIKGKTLEEAEKVTNRDIAEYLGGLPEQKMHCSVMGREALEAAIHNYRTGETGTRELKEDRIVCECFGVTESEIVQVVTENRLSTVEQVTHYTKAGGACGRCKGEIQKILDQLLERRAREEGPKDPAKMTNVQRMRLIEKVLDAEIRPALRHDGGDVELVDVNGMDIQIAFHGMCKGCPSAEQTRVGFIQKLLREKVSPEINVSEAKGE